MRKRGGLRGMTQTHFRKARRTLSLIVAASISPFDHLHPYSAGLRVRYSMSYSRSGGCQNGGSH